MSVIIKKQTYHCYNDCSQAGCPGHTATVEFQSVTDYTIFDDGKGKKIGLEPPELNAFIDMLKDLDEQRADAPVKLSPHPKKEEVGEE